MVRGVLLLAALATLLALGGCADVAGGIAAANVAAIPVFGRSVSDVAVSAVTGRNCSIVHWDQGKPYCTPQEQPPLAPPYCTPSLGYADCWASPTVFSDPPPGVADGPYALTPAQDQNRTRSWLDFGF
jgi:hypothetical protein